jgi:hypothetical protein
LTRLFHFSEDDSIRRFDPRPVRQPSERPPGMDWLNGPLVWAIDAWHQPLYLFPRDCPRILVWPAVDSAAADVERILGDSGARMAAYVEEGWLPELNNAALFRYELPVDGFEDLRDAGMWVNRAPVRPLGRMRVDDLRQRLEAAEVLLCPVPSLAPLRPLWKSTLKVSGIRLRNARGWGSSGV